MKASTLVQLQSPEKENKIDERKDPKHVFLNYVEIILLNVYNEIFVRIEADQHERMSCLLHKIAGKWRLLVQQQSMKYQQQYIRSRRKARKTIANCLYLDLLCVFSALVYSATGTRLRI